MEKSVTLAGKCIMERTQNLNYLCKFSYCAKGYNAKDTMQRKVMLWFKKKKVIKYLAKITKALCSWRMKWYETGIPN